MTKSFSNWAILEKAMKKEMNKAFEKAVNNSYQDLKDNVEFFYSVPEPTYPGHYHRTGQLKDSPMLDGITHRENSSVGQISINTSTQYDPAGIDTERIYELADDDKLVGAGGFWRATEHDVERNLRSAFPDADIKINPF